MRWAIALAIAVVITGAALLAWRIGLRRVEAIARRTATRYDDALVQVLARTRVWSLVAIAIGAGVRSLELPAEADLWIGRGVIVAVAIQGGLWASAGIRALVGAGPARSDARPGDRTFGAAAGFVSGLVIWSIVVLLVLSNFGVEVGTLVAGLGIGGVAAALAVQNVLGDLFAALSIYLDRPFDIGDFVIVDEYKGTVERISWRSTQIRSLGGELVVLANSDLARARLRNYRRMAERRVVVQLGIEYGTPAALVARVPTILREAIADIEGLRFDRAHFHRFGESSLDFEAVFYVLSAEYNEFMDRQQRLLLSVYRRFEEEDIAFAFPTRTVHVRGAPAAAPPVG